MPRYIALFRDKPEAEAGWVRKAHDKEHFEYLAAHSARIVIGGWLRPDWGEWWSGGLRVLEVADRAEAIALGQGALLWRCRAVERPR